MNKPLMFDLFCGLGGATEGFLLEGWNCIGIDIERHKYADQEYPAQLWVQDIQTISGAQLRDADFIWASPPCQFFSYCAMPWTRAKTLAAKVRSDPVLLAKELALFNACFRIQAEASLAAGRHIPMVVENVRGAIPWVGRSRWNFGSFHLWGDVPALMPATFKAVKVPNFRFDGSGKSFQSASVEHTGVKAPGMNWSDPTKRGQDFTRLAGAHAIESAGRRTDPGKGARFTSRDCGVEGTKNGNDWFGSGEDCSMQRRHGSKSPGRKQASAMIAKIPLPLSRHIAATYLP